MFSNPRHNIDQLGLSDGHVVADFGAGSGHYALEIAKAVAPTGRVFAIDVHKSLLEKVKKDAQKNHLRNIDILTGDLETLGGSKIRELSCDAVIASNILFMISEKKNLILEAKRILKPFGRLLVIDWTASFSGMGPHGDHVFYKDDCIKLVSSLGFNVEREIQAGGHHYGIIFRKN